MALSLQQVLRQTQKLIMTPQMQQSIQLLQLNSMELEQLIHQEMMENPFLELTDDEENLATVETDDGEEREAPASDGPEADSGLSEQAASEQQREVSADDEPEAPAPKTDAIDGAVEERHDDAPESQDFESLQQTDFDWDQEFSDSDTTSYTSTREDVEEHDFTTYTALAENLYDSLQRQLRLSALSGKEVDIGEFLIGNLDGDGFLDCTLENQAKILGYPTDLVDVRPGKESEDVLRRMLTRVRGKEHAEHIRQLNRKQLVASLVAHFTGVTPDEAMTMSRKEQLIELIAARLGMPAEEIAAMRPSELILLTIGRRLKIDPQQVYDVLEVIQDFEPTGVGARDLAECLRLQCEEQGIRNRLLYRILDDHLEDLQQKRFREIARTLDVPESKVLEVFHLISRLDPRPGQSQTKDTPRYITPDVYVKKVDGKYMYFLNEGDAGRLRIASNYRRMIIRDQQARRLAQQAHTAAQAEAQAQGLPQEGGSGDNGRSSDATYAHEKYKNAVWLIKNIEKRKSTVLRVTEAIMNYQKDFLEKGIEHLRPLTLRNIAEVVGMHESTIARVTTQKYVETPRGIFELKFFFSSGLETDQGEDASSRSIKEIITQMIAAEDVKKPLSDQKIADMLKQRGINIARRTVAKYREQLKILPAKLRKQVN